MPTPSKASYVGKKVSLISTANIRYEGTIYVIDNDRITLQNVRIFGTEDRDCDVFIDVMQEIRPAITFNRSGIQSIGVIQDFSFYDPSIVSQVVDPPSSAKGRRDAVSDLEERLSSNDYRPQEYHTSYETEPIRGDFNFEASNSTFDMDYNDEVSPAYDKTDFFDSLHERSEERKVFSRRRNPHLNEETFGREGRRNRENRASRAAYGDRGAFRGGADAARYPYQDRRSAHQDRAVQRGTAVYRDTRIYSNRKSEDYSRYDE